MIKEQMCLTPYELYELTGHRRYDAQVRALQTMGVVHMTRPNKTVAVLKEHVLTLLGCKTSVRKEKRVEPNYDGLNA